MDQPVRVAANQPQAPQPQPAPAAPATDAKSKTAPIKSKKFNAKTIALVVLVLALVAASGYVFWQYLQVKNENARLSNPQEAARVETERLVGKVSGLVLLPEGENPTVATVVDAGKLKEQPFFAKAENGDKVLMYTQAKKAYLYRPATNRVVEVAPIAIGEKTGTEAEQN